VVQVAMSSKENNVMMRMRMVMMVTITVRVPMLTVNVTTVSAAWVLLP
jgi:hypothetical protein